MTHEAEVIPLNDAPGAQALALIAQRPTLMSLARMTAPELRAQQRATYLEAEQQGIIQYLTAFVRRYGTPGADGTQLTVTDNLEALVITLHVFAPNQTIEVRVKTEQGAEVIAVSDRLPGEERFVIGSGRWLRAIERAVAAAEQSAAHAARLRDRQERADLIADSSANI